MIDKTRVKPPCTKCNTGLVHDACYSSSEPLPVEGYNSLWNDDNPELVKRVGELEAKVEEMWERIKQFEAVMSTAFRLHIENNLNRCT
jgi:hypothetical protein